MTYRYKDSDYCFSSLFGYEYVFVCVYNKYIFILLYQVIEDALTIYHSI